MPIKFDGILNEFHDVYIKIFFRLKYHYENI